MKTLDLEKNEKKLITIVFSSLDIDLSILFISRRWVFSQV